MRTYLLLIFFAPLLPNLVLAQQDSTYRQVYKAHVEGEDTVVSVMLDQAIISDNARWNSTYFKRYNRLLPKVVKVYPYAKAAGDIMKEYDRQLQEIHGEKERKAFIQQAETDMKEQFEGDLRKMTVSEGVILIKLIDRETGDTSYELIQELKGNFSAFMWQSLARLFGHNLKDLYDGDGDDIMIEQIVRKIEKNEIAVDYKSVSLSD